MKTIRNGCLPLGRFLLVLGLIPTVFAQSTVGEAFVLHRHGVLKAHVHLLGFGDLLSNAASSAEFGHDRVAEVKSTTQRVCPIAIVKTGLVFVPTSGPECNDAVVRGFPHTIAVIVAADPQQPPTTDRLIQTDTIHAAKNSIAVILLQNHTLLI